MKQVIAIVLALLILFAVVFAVWYRRTLARLAARERATLSREKCAMMVRGLEERIRDLRYRWNRLCQECGGDDGAECNAAVNQAIAVASTTIGLYWQLEDIRGAHKDWLEFATEQYEAAYKEYAILYIELEKTSLELDPAFSACSRLRQLTVDTMRALDDTVDAHNSAYDAMNAAEQAGFDMADERKSYDESHALLAASRDRFENKEMSKALDLAERSKNGAIKVFSKVEGLPRKKAELERAQGTERARIRQVRATMYARRAQYCAPVAGCSEDMQRSIRERIEIAAGQISDAFGCLNRAETAINKSDLTNGEQLVDEAKSLLDLASAFLASVVVLKTDRIIIAAHGALREL